MKLIYKSTLSCFIAFAMAGIFTSCSEEDSLSNGGEPSVFYVRVTNPEASDSLLVSAGQGSTVAIVGENLQDAQQIWFNDLRAELSPTYITATSIITRVPPESPAVVSNKLKIIFANGDSLLHDFTVDISAPVINSMVSEYVDAGDIATIKGDYFYEPLTVTFAGDVTGDIVDVADNLIQVKVPEGAAPGPITVSTNFGQTVSVLWFRDNRNIILNYDDLTAAGSWRPGPVASEDGIDGNYLKLGGTLSANQRIEDDFEAEFWGHTRLPEGNLFEGDPKDLVLKFEARVVDWYGSYFQICWGPWNNSTNAEVWSNLNGRGLWRPWEESNKNFTTNGEWITVAIPLSEMKYSHGQTGAGNIWTADMEFDKNIAGSLSFWIIATPEANDSPVEVHIDNVRIVNK